MDHTLGESRHSVLMGDHHQGGTMMMKVDQHMYDVVRGPSIEIPRRFVG